MLSNLSFTKSNISGIYVCLCVINQYQICTLSATNNEFAKLSKFQIRGKEKDETREEPRWKAEANETDE